MSNDERELRLAWQRHVGTGGVADGWFDTVCGHHRAPGRSYHDLRHVRWVVHHGRELAGSIEVALTPDETDQVVAAAFFHDAEYDPKRTDNEAVSARLAERALAEIGWPRDTTTHVATMIEATAGHDLTESDDMGAAVLVAADLGVLATEPARYLDYTRAVRREYGHIDDDGWRVGRAAFIVGMLERDTIFPGVLHLDDWERRARANLTAELAALD